MPRRRYIVIVNPHAGARRGLAILKSVEPVFSAANAELDIRTTTHAGHAWELAWRLPLENYDGVSVLGGDGSVHEVVNGLMRREQGAAIPLGLIPGGTGNTVAEHLGCLDPVLAARRIVAGQPRPLDVARVLCGETTTFCVNIVGWGAAADISRTAERLRPLGASRYALSALWHVARARHRRARVAMDGRVIEDDYSLIAGCNTRFTGKGMKLAPDAAVDDGLIDLVLVRRAGRRQLAVLFRKVFDGSHVSLPCVEIHRVRSFSIESATPEPLGMDGELTGSTPVRVEMIPSALQVFS